MTICVLSPSNHPTCSQIYVRSVAGSDSYDPIQEIECRVPYNKPDQNNSVETQNNIKMSFYSDSEFSRGFDTNANEIDNELLQLGDNKVTYWKMLFLSSPPHDFIFFGFYKLKTRLTLLWPRFVHRKRALLSCGNESYEAS